MNNSEFLKMIVERSTTEWLEPSEQQPYEEGWLQASKWWADKLLYVLSSDSTTNRRSDLIDLAESILNED